MLSQPAMAIKIATRLAVGKHGYGVMATASKTAVGAVASITFTQRVHCVIDGKMRMMQ